MDMLIRIGLGYRFAQAQPKKEGWQRLWKTLKAFSTHVALDLLPCTFSEDAWHALGSSLFILVLGARGS